MQAAIETARTTRKHRPRKTEFIFEELSPEAQEKAMEWYRSGDNSPYDGWYETIYEDWKEKLQEQGFEKVEFFWSGFWSQGDGACFTATVDLEKYIKANVEGILKGRISDIFTLRKIIKNDPCESDWEVETPFIKREGHYYHEKTMESRLDWRGDAPPEIEKTLVGLQDCILENARSLAKAFYKALEKEYEYLTGDECTKENIIANEYLFNENGERI